MSASMIHPYFIPGPIRLKTIPSGEVGNVRRRIAVGREWQRVESLLVRAISSSGQLFVPFFLLR